MSPYEDLKLLSTVTTERHNRHRLSEAYSDWETRAMRSRLFSGAQTQQPPTAADEEDYVFVGTPDVSSSKDADHDQAAALTDQTPFSGIQQLDPTNDDEQKNGQRHDIMASSPYCESHEQSLLTIAPSDCVAKAHRSALSRDTRDLSFTSECQSLVEAWASREQSDQRASAETDTSTTTKRGLSFFETLGTWLVAHYVSYLLLAFPALITDLELTNKTPSTLWQLCAFVAMYAVFAVVRDRWMAYMSSSPEQKKPGGTMTMAALGDFGTAVAAKAAHVALVCAVGELFGITRLFLSLMERWEILGALEGPRGLRLW